jgi:choline dehydrogenase-like flavoprotein
MDQLGVRWTQNALAILTGRHEGRSPCMNYGYCQWGCKSRAKGSMHVTYAPKAVLAGAEIRAQARAVQLEVDDRTGEVTGVLYVRNGTTHRQVADVYVLSAFCIEDPRLLLHSATSVYPNGLANSSGTLAGTLLAHVADSHFGRFEQSVHQWSTAPGTLLSQEHYGTQPGRRFAGGWSWMTSCLFPAEFAITLARAGPGWWSPRLVDELQAYPHYAVLGTEGECLPSAENRVELSEDVDEHGVPRPRVTFSYGDNEHAMRDEIHRLGTAILEGAGATSVVSVRATITPWAAAAWELIRPPLWSARTCAAGTTPTCSSATPACSPLLAAPSHPRRSWRWPPGWPTTWTAQRRPRPPPPDIHGPLHREGS